MTRYELVPWHDPDGRETWAIRRVLVGPDYFGRVVVSWHPTRGAAEAEIRSLEETTVSEETGVTPLRAWAVAALSVHDDFIARENSERRGGHTCATNPPTTFAENIRNEWLENLPPDMWYAVPLIALTNRHLAQQIAAMEAELQRRRGVASP